MAESQEIDARWVRKTSNTWNMLCKLEKWHERDSGWRGEGVDKGGEWEQWDQNNKDMKGISSGAKSRQSKQNETKQNRETNNLRSPCPWHMSGVSSVAGEDGKRRREWKQCWQNFLSFNSHNIIKHAKENVK